MRRSRRGIRGLWATASRCTRFWGRTFVSRGHSERLGQKALEALDEYAPDFISFARAIELAGSQHLAGSPAWPLLQNPFKRIRRGAQGQTLRLVCMGAIQRVRGKLQREPVEDFRIDFETGSATGRMKKRSLRGRRCGGTRRRNGGGQPATIHRTSH